MRHGAAAAALLLLCCAGRAQAQRGYRHRRYYVDDSDGPQNVGTPGDGLLDPMITRGPNLRQYNGPWSGTRDIQPAGETNNLFIGGWSQTALPLPPMPPLPPPRPIPPAAQQPQQLPGEGVEPPTDASLPQAGDDDTSLDTPGETYHQEAAEPALPGGPSGQPQVLPDLPAAPNHQSPGEDVAAAPAATAPRSAGAVSVEPVPPGESEDLPDLPPAPDHASPGEDVSAAPAAVSRQGAGAVSVQAVTPGQRQALPDLPAAPDHVSAPEDAKPIQMDDDVALVHDAIPDLIQILKTGGPRLRERAADELGRRGQDAKAAVPALILALKNGHDRLRASAALALGDIGGDTKTRKTLTKLLKPLLKSKNADVRTSAETALQRLWYAPT